MEREREIDITKKLKYCPNLEIIVRNLETFLK